MAVRKIFVNPGDLVIVHVINDPELPKNEKEWSGSAVRPFKIYFTMEIDGVTFHDPATDIGVSIGKENRRRIN